MGKKEEFLNEMIGLGISKERKGKTVLPHRSACIGRKSSQVPMHLSWALGKYKKRKVRPENMGRII